MNTEPTPATARALEAAARWARHEQAAAVQPRHLLLGLVEEDEGRVALLLRGAGLVLERIRDRATPEPTPVDLPLDAASRDVLFHAGTVCASFSADRTLATEHLLFALLLKDEGL